MMTHNAPIHKIKAPKSQVINWKDSIPSNRPNEKEKTDRGALTLQIPFQGKTTEGEPRNLL